VQPGTGPRPVTYSVVVPVCNEEESLPELHGRLAPVLDALDGPAEIVFVNDGSQDRSLEILKELRRRDPRVKVLSFSRNFGHQVAITAGLDHAAGEAMVILDADLQDPPELIPELAAKWREGFEVVYAVRTRREGESAFKRGTALLFYRLLRRLTSVDIPPDAGDFRLLGARAAGALRSMRERRRFLRGMTSWVGFRQAGVPYVREERAAGRTKYPLGKMIGFALDGVTSFSAAPLKLATWLGFAGALLGMVYLVWVLYLRFVENVTIVGWASLMAAILFLGSLQLLTLGILGEYIARISDEVRDRPLYIVEEAEGFARPAVPAAISSAAPGGRA
jgi:dolichol-phosphate mannosyltransferase